MVPMALVNGMYHEIAYARKEIECWKCKKPIDIDEPFSEVWAFHMMCPAIHHYYHKACITWGRRFLGLFSVASIGWTDHW